MKILLKRINKAWHNNEPMPLMMLFSVSIGGVAGIGAVYLYTLNLYIWALITLICSGLVWFIVEVVVRGKDENTPRS